MDYRKLSRFFAAIDLCLSIILVLWVSFRGFTLVEYTFDRYKQRPSELFGLWIAYVVAAFFSFVSVIASRRLFKATEKGTSPAEALRLCQLWWILSWISMVIVLLAFIIETFVMLHVFSAHVVNGDEYIRWKYYMNSTYLILHGSALFCVHKYKRQMNASIPHTVTELLIPLDDTELSSYQSSPFPVSYEDIKASGIYEPPPPYNPSFGIHPY